jgi:polysaccharide pyruvyl transferase WcaK-like protein
MPIVRETAQISVRRPVSIEILTALKGNSTPGKRDYIFAEPTGRPLSEKALRRARHRINPAISVHGMRSTFRDWGGDNTKFPRELAELPSLTLSRAPPRLPTGAMMLLRDAAP